jgi:hypothetical protein
MSVIFVVSRRIEYGFIRMQYAARCYFQWALLSYEDKSMGGSSFKQNL